MNKLLTKIVGIALGATMAIGVGVAVAFNKDTVPARADTTAMNEDLTYASLSGTYFNYSLDQNGGSNAPNHTSDIRIYNKNTLTITANSDYASSVAITSVEITGKNSKSGNTQTVYYDPDGGTLVTSGTSVSWGTGTGSATRTATFTGSNLTSVVFYQAGANNVQISNLKVNFDYTATAAVEATGMSISPAGPVTVIVGETVTFTPTLTGGSGNYEKTIGWTSSNTSIVAKPSNSEAGVAVEVTTLAAGSTTITGTVVSPGSASASITINAKELSGIAVTTAPTKTVYNAGESFDKTGMVVTATYSDASTSDVTSSCTFAPNPLTYGTTEVTDSYGGKTTTQAVTVNKVSSVTFTAGTDMGTNGSSGHPDSITKSGITFSGTSLATTTAEYRLYSGSTVTFTSTIGKMASIQFTRNGSYAYSLISVNDDNGEYDDSTGLWEGETASVSFHLSGQFRADAIQVTIGDPTVTLNKASVNVEKDDEDTSVIASTKFFSGTPTITASTESDLIAVEYTSGHLDILAGSTAGEATVTITATYSTEVANVNLTVYVIEASVPVTGITVTKEHNNDLYIGQTVQLTATVTPNNATDGTVTWSSSSESIATVNPSGLVTAAGVGTATITATANDGSGVKGTASVTVVSFPTFTKVTSTDELFNGMTVVIASEAGTNLLSTTQNSNNRGIVGSSINSSIVTPSALGFAELTLGVEEMDDGTIVYSFYDPANSGYLYAANSSNNYMRTEANLDDNGRFSLSISDGVATLLAQGTYTHNYIRFNSTLFSCYAPNSTTGTSVSLFAKTGQTITDAQKIETFIAKNMKMNSYDKGGDEGSTTGDGSCTTYYATAKAAFNSNTLMSDSARSAFCSEGTYSAAYKRLRDWATANEDSFNGTTHVLETNRGFSLINDVNDFSNLTAIIVIISMIGLTAIGGYFFLRKRKEVK